MARYKDLKKTTYSARFLRFEEGEMKELTVTDWDFSKNPAGYLFRCFVSKENGEEVDKIWTVWEYESTQLLKKKLGTKYTSGSKDLKVKMYKDEDEQMFEFVK